MSKHLPTVVILLAIAFQVIWANGKFNDIEKRLVVIENALLRIEIAVQKIP